MGWAGMGDCGSRGSCGGGKPSRACPEDTGPPLFGRRQDRGPVFFWWVLWREQRTKESLHTALRSHGLFCGPEHQPLCWLLEKGGTFVCLLSLLLFICFDLFLIIKCHSSAGHESSWSLSMVVSLFI